jgi:hypothetical protein
MQPPQRQTPPPSLPRPPDVREREPLPTAPVVAVVFKEHRYEDGAPKIWYFAQIDQVACLHGRVQLLREGYGVVFDVPNEEVERVYTVDKDRAFPSGHAAPLRPG